MTDRARYIYQFSTTQPTDDDLLVGSDVSANNLTRVFTVGEIRNRPLQTPANNNLAGLPVGSIVFDNNYAYFVVTSTLVKRVALVDY